MKNLIKKELTEELKSVESPPVETEITNKEKEEMKTGTNLIHAYIDMMRDAIYCLPSITRDEIEEGKRKTNFRQLARYLKLCGAQTDSHCHRKNFDGFGDLVWYEFGSNCIVNSNLDGFSFLLPMPKSFADGNGEKVLFIDNVTDYQVKSQSKIITGAKEIMQTIKESAVKTKDQVIKTAIGQAGVAGIKSLILTALPMKIGFIGRLLGRHKAVANNSLVVAGIAILANQAAQKFITNEAAKNALQATQDQAVTEVLNEYIGIENQIQKTVSKTLDLEKSPVTIDQQD